MHNFNHTNAQSLRGCTLMLAATPHQEGVDEPLKGSKAGRLPVRILGQQSSIAAESFACTADTIIEELLDRAFQMNGIAKDKDEPIACNTNDRETHAGKAAEPTCFRAKNAEDADKKKAGTWVEWEEKRGFFWGLPE
eukprot:1161662-Pelagomonas_calceolata.AAC.12